MYVDLAEMVEYVDPPIFTTLLLSRVSQFSCFRYSSFFFPHQFGQTKPLFNTQISQTLPSYPHSNTKSLGATSASLIRYSRSHLVLPLHLLSGIQSLDKHFTLHSAHIVATLSPRRQCQLINASIIRRKPLLLACTLGIPQG